jgi:aryl-alcohol dehydrogenase-like predicted oxidoreductase
MATTTLTIGGDLDVYRFGFGAMRITGDGIWGEPPDEGAARDLLRRVVQTDVNLIDTADSYGPEVSERLIAEALHPYPENLVIATKGGLERPGPNRWTANARPEHLKRCCEGSLRRLKLERIDLYQLHRVDPNVPIEDSVGALAELQEDGKIRHIGLSNVNGEQLGRAQQIVPIVSVQNRYNVADRESEDVLQACEDSGLAFFPWAPLGSRGSNNLAQAGGLLDDAARAHGASPGQVALAWLLHRSPNILLIPGTSSVEHLRENVAAAELDITAVAAELDAIGG